MSGTLLRGEEKDKRHHGLIAALRESPTRLGPVSWTCYCGGQEGHFCRECLKGDSPGDSPTPNPNQDPALCKGNHRRSKCPHHQMEGEMPPSMDWWVQASWPNSTSWHQCWGAIMSEKQKVIFLLESGACFSVLPFSPGPRSNDKSYHLGQIWLATIALVSLVSGLLLGRPPLLSH
jgi:hypothetical protein